MKKRKLLAALLALVMVVSLAAALPSAQGYQGGKLIALTFDDGPGPYTSRLLDGLAARGVNVTFFMLGENVARYPELVKRMYREGHQLANHSYSHGDLTGLSDSKIRSEIEDTNALLDKAAGYNATYVIRAPYGNTNSRVRSVAGAPFIYWSVDPQDWKDRDANTVKNRVVNNAHDGAIILLHDIHSTSVDGALAAIDILLDKGYEFVTIRELFRRRGVTLEDAVSYSRCSPNGTDYGAVKAPAITSRVVNGKTEVTLTAQSGASIYYSLDGPEMNADSSRYTGPFTVDVPCTVWAVAAYNMNGDRSAVVSQSFTKVSCLAPKIHVYKGEMTLQNNTPGASLFYTLDGSTATESSTRYTGPVYLTPGTVISACAGGANYYTSPAVRATYTHLGNFVRDVFPHHWYYEDVDQVMEAGYMKGVGENYFDPEGLLNRAQIVTLLYRYAGETVTEAERAACTFADLEAGRYYVDAVCWARARGIIHGYDAVTFDPERRVSRQEMCKIFYAYLEYQGKALPHGAGSAEKYTDAKDIAPWALSYVESMTACGLVQGDKEGTFRPTAGAIRGQAATLLIRLEGLMETLPERPGEP